MNIKVVGKNIEITPAIKDYVEKRLERLEKFESEQTEVTVVCSVEREEQIVEVQINHNGEFIRVEERNPDLYASIDVASDKAERQLRKDKEKKAKKNKAASLKDKISNMFVGENKDNSSNAVSEIAKINYYDTKPITFEDAKQRLSERHDDLFMAFVDADSGDVHVIYKKGNDTYGIVLPE